MIRTFIYIWRYHINTKYVHVDMFVLKLYFPLKFL
jgi:hypothetical protein